MCQQFLLHFSEMGKSFSLKPCWKRTCEFCQVGLFVCPCVCVVVLQNENFEGKNQRRPWVNNNSFSNQKKFLRSPGLLGKEAQWFKWRLSLCRSSESILCHLKGENVPKSTEQFPCASSFFFISAKWAKVSAWSLVEKETHGVLPGWLVSMSLFVCVVVLQKENFEGKNQRRPWVNNNSFSNQKKFLRSPGLLGKEAQWFKWRVSLCRSSESILCHLKGENVPKSTGQKLCQQFLLHVSEMEKSFSLKPCWKRNTWSFARLACFYVFVCVCRCASENRRRTWVTSNSFLLSLALFERDILKRSTFLLGPGSLNNQFEMVVSVGWFQIIARTSACFSISVQ